MPGVAEDRVIKHRSPPTLQGGLSLFGFRSRTYTGSTTLTVDDLGAVIFNTASANATYTLPDPMGEGGFFLFVSASTNVGAAMTITAPTDKLRTIGDAVNATSIAFNVNAAQVGAACLVISDGAAYWALPITSQVTVNTGLALYAVT